MRAKIDCLKHEHGAAVVEAIIAFTGFLFVIFTILNVVNFCRAQATISNAVDSAAKEMAQYAYFYEMSGLQKFSDKLDSNASVGAGQVNEVIGTVETFYGSIGTLKDNTLEDASRFQKTIEAGEIDTSQIETALTNLETNGNNVQAAFSSMSSSFGDILDNPLKYVKSMVAIGANQGLNMIKSYVIAAPIAKALTLKHFGKTAGEASKALENLGVVGGADGMNFNMSSIFHSSTPDEVHLAVYYKLKLVQLFDWANFEVPLCKEAVARAWLGGDDVIVKMEPTTNPPAGGGEKSPGESSQEGEAGEGAGGGA